MNKIMIKDNDIKSMIYEIRGKQVMLDSDLAKLYGCANGTKSINLAVKRHLKRFPERFMFQLTNEELKLIPSRFQSETLEVSKRGTNIKYLSYVFTEQGVAMLSSVLRTPVAEEVSIRIMDAFVAMRKFMSNSLLEQRYINSLVLKHDDDIKFLKETFDKFENTSNNHLFFEGQIYDAYNLMMEILTNAKEKIIIIDNYAGRELFNLIKNITVPIKIYTKNIDKEAIIKYMKQYDNIEIINNYKFHDRFIIIDDSILYHCGASFKELGKKCFGINKIEDTKYLKILLDQL
ncbi:MAG: ORF6N domain-containing protein [Bacilli bacterium]|nr:ORF6N domain-containing protein [Bacilli bacterium]